MGNYRLSRLSHIIPNAWFCKLKAALVKSTRRYHNTSSTASANHDKHHHASSSSSSLSPSSSSSSHKTGQQSHLARQRKSYHFTGDLTTPAHHDVDATRISSIATNSAVEPSSSHNHSSPEMLDAMHSSWSSVLSCKFNDHKKEAVDGFVSVSEFLLPPIKTKSWTGLSKSEDMKNRGKRNQDEEQRSISPEVKLRTKSPIIIGKKRIIVSGQGRRRRKKRSLWESLAVVKSSKDPKRDFRDSMVEMIVANEIRGSRDLEHLLACYLWLNSNQYHELIIGVFRQIWFEIYTESSSSSSCLLSAQRPN